MHPKVDEYLHLYAKFIIMNDYHSIIKLRKLHKPLLRISDGEIFAFLGGKAISCVQDNSDALSIALANVYTNKNIVLGLLKPSLSYINLIM